jgi:hypothetical protein
MLLFWSVSCIKVVARGAVQNPYLLSGHRDHGPNVLGGELTQIPFDQSNAVQEKRHEKRHFGL